MRYLYVVALALILSCAGDTTAPVDQVAGTWLLSAYGDLSVPADVAELPGDPHDETPSGCFLRLTGGDLVFTSSDASFRYRYEFHDSCTGALLSSRDVRGTYEATGQAIHFTELTPSRDAFTGTLTGGTIVLPRGTEPVLGFTRGTVN